jgi:hypothetical protein
MERANDIAFFKQTCTSCFNDVEIPVLGDLSSYGEMLYQTSDAKYFALVDLIRNPAFDLIRETLQACNLPERAAADVSQFILCTVSDPVGSQRYSIQYPRCPLCGKLLSSWSDEHLTSRRPIASPSWAAFLALSEPERVKLVRGLVSQRKP